MLSKFIESIPYGDDFLIFNVLKPVPILLSNEQFHSLKNNKINGFLESDLNDLKISHCLPAEDSNELLEEAFIKVKKMLEFPRIIYVTTTLNCNSSCEFCIVPSRSHEIKNKVLATEDMRTGLMLINSFFEKYHPVNTEPVTIVFYGGEPLMNIGVIKETIKFVRSTKTELFNRVKFHLCTNGYLLDLETISFLKSEGVSITVAFEPLRAVHNIYRSNYLNVYNSILECLRVGINTSLSIAMVPESISQISNIIDVIDNIGLTSFGFNFIRGSYLNKKLVDVDQYADSLVSELSKQFDRLIGREYQITKRYKMIESRNPMSIDCTCYGNQFVIFPDGTIGNCPFETSGTCNPTESNSIDSLIKTKNRWTGHILSEELFTNKETFGFGGGCYWGALDGKQSCDVVTKKINQLLMKALVMYFFTNKNE